MKVLVLHTLPPTEASAGRTVDEFDLSSAAHGIAESLGEAKAKGIRGEPQEILALIDALQPKVIFNLCEAPLGRPDLEAGVAALFEWLGVRFTGSGSETLALCRRKDRMNAALSAAGVPIPLMGGFPCIVKPADEDGSAGIHADSVCHDEAALARAKARLQGPAVVQNFLSGREFVASVWGRVEPEYFSIGETTFQNDLRLITYAAKWDLDSLDFAYSPLDYNTAIDARLREAIVKAVSGAWYVAEIRGYARVDVRLDEHRAPAILDVNPNPELGPGVGICRAVQEAGWTWERFLRKQVEWA